jgi:hypothetical protein
MKGICSCLFAILGLLGSTRVFAYFERSVPQVATVLSDSQSMQQEIIASIDAFLNWKLLATFINYKLNEVPLWLQQQRTHNPTSTYAGLMQCLEQFDVYSRTARGTNWIAFEYDLPSEDVKTMFDAIVASAIGRNSDTRHILLGIVPAITATGCYKYVVIMRKTDQAQLILQDFEIGGFPPIATYKLKYRHGHAKQSEVLHG